MLTRRRATVQIAFGLALPFFIAYSLWMLWSLPQTCAQRAAVGDYSEREACWKDMHELTGE